jgi:hypothetical protein
MPVVGRLGLERSDANWPLAHSGDARGCGGGVPAVQIRVLLYNLIVSRQNRSRHSCKHSTKIVKVVASWCLWFLPSH